MAFYGLAQSPATALEDWVHLLRGVAPGSWLLEGDRLQRAGDHARHLIHNELSRLLAEAEAAAPPAQARAERYDTWRKAVAPRRAKAAGAKATPKAGPAGPPRIRINDPRFEGAPDHVLAAREQLRGIMPVFTGLHAKLKECPDAPGRADILRRMARMASARRAAWRAIDAWAQGLDRDA